MEASIEKIDTVKAAFERASALVRAGDTHMAESVCRDALGRFPADGNLLCLLGGLLTRQRRPDEAEKALSSVIERFPEFAKAHEELGNALMTQHRPEEAAECFQRTIELEPDNGPAHYKLGKVLAAIGRTKDAEQAHSTSSRLAPTQDALARAGERRNAGQLKEAEEIYRDILTRDPDNADVFQLLGVLAMEQGQFGDAAVLLRRTVTLAPNMVVAWIDLGKALGEREDFDEAIDAIQQAIQLEPQVSLPYGMIGNFRARMGQYGEAIDAYNSGLEIHADNAACLAGLGNVLKIIGQHDDAVQAYRNLIRIHPEFAEAYWSLANLKNVRFESTEIQAMHEHVSNEKLSEETRIHFCFALGKAYEDEAEYERAFEFYQRGNSARRKNEVYDAVDTEAINDRIIRVFDRVFLKDGVGPGDQDSAPILIVGLPRSGSTLIEQILASHSQVDGTHELPDLDRVILRINRQCPNGAGYPEALQDFGATELEDLGQQYLDSTRRYRTGKPFFTDKMPNNFRGIGLLSLILPNAKVINARRHPLDSCMGSYKQLFFKGQPFTYDLFELGEYYLEYQRLMDHWHQVLPGRIFDIHYEDVVCNTEREIRRLLEYCGLAWEEACLNFFDTERAIDSASSEQVRQPIYSTSVNNWRHFEGQLAELIDILQPLLEKLPEDQRPATLCK